MFFSDAFKKETSSLAPPRAELSFLHPELLLTLPKMAGLAPSLRQTGALTSPTRGTGGECPRTHSPSLPPRLTRGQTARTACTCIRRTAPLLGQHHMCPEPVRPTVTRPDLDKWLPDQRKGRPPHHRHARGLCGLVMEHF